MASFQNSKLSDNKRYTVEVRWGILIEYLTVFGKISAQPHTTLCIQFLNRENNDKNNTFPLGKQICFTIVWGCAETLPSIFIFLREVVNIPIQIIILPLLLFRNDHPTAEARAACDWSRLVPHVFGERFSQLMAWLLSLTIDPHDLLHDRGSWF